MSTTDIIIGIAALAWLIVAPVIAVELAQWLIKRMENKEKQ